MGTNITVIPTMQRDDRPDQARSQVRRRCSISGAELSSISSECRSCLVLCLRRRLRGAFSLSRLRLGGRLLPRQPVHWPSSAALSRIFCALPRHVLRSTPRSSDPISAAFFGRFGQDPSSRTSQPPPFSLNSNPFWSGSPRPRTVLRHILHAGLVRRFFHGPLRTRAPFGGSLPVNLPI